MEVRMQWVCEICGYVHDGEEPPPSCVICGAPSSKFVEWTEGDSDGSEDKSGGPGSDESKDGES